MAFGSGPSIVNADFSSVPIVCGGDYSYQWLGGDCNSIPPQQDFNNAPSFGWTFITAGGSGLAGPNAFDTPASVDLRFPKQFSFKGTAIQSTKGSAFLQLEITRWRSTSDRATAVV